MRILRQKNYATINPLIGNNNVAGNVMSGVQNFPKPGMQQQLPPLPQQQNINNPLLNQNQMKINNTALNNNNVQQQQKPAPKPGMIPMPSTIVPMNI